jgi:hypothetical protein
LEALKNIADDCEYCGGSGRETESIDDDTQCHVCGYARSLVAKAGGYL